MLATGYGVIFTVLDDYRDLYGIGETALGGIVGIGFFSAFVAQILIGPLADRGFARRLMLIGVALNVLGLVAMAFGTTLLTLLIGRFVMGLGIGTALPAIRRIVILGDPENVGLSLGRLLSADVAGFATGPAISAFLVPAFGLASPFLVVAGLTLAWTAFIGKVDVEESQDATTQATLALDLLRNPAFAGAVMLGTALFVMIGAFDALWAVVLSDLNTRDWIANVGITFFAMPLIFLGPTGGRLAERIGPFKVAVVGLLLGAAFMASYGLVPGSAAMLAVAVIHALSDGLTVASSGVAVAMTTPEDRQAGGQGVLGGAQTLAAGVTAVLVGAIYETSGRAWAYGAAAILMVILVAGGAWLARSAWQLTAKNRPQFD